MRVTMIEARVEEPNVPQEPDGGARAEHCPTCGAGLPEDSRFCGQCGRALAATLAPAPGDLLTIAFLDLEGFTTFASRSEEDDVRGLIRAFHGLVRGELGRHGGFEVKQLGDGFMLAFSSPARAVACAADIQRAMANPMAPSIRLNVGMNSGDAVREGDDFFGHTVNVASRIAEKATGGQVLVSEATRVLAGHVESVRFEDAGRRRLRGLRRRHRVFDVIWSAPSGPVDGRSGDGAGPA
jgi:class 3 adenylate cyclase